jgi:hypothetical protein
MTPDQQRAELVRNARPGRAWMARTLLWFLNDQAVGMLASRFIRSGVDRGSIHVVEHRVGWPLGATAQSVAISTAIDTALAATAPLAGDEACAAEVECQTTDGLGWAGNGVFTGGGGER